MRAEKAQAEAIGTDVGVSMEEVFVQVGYVGFISSVVICYTLNV